MVGSVANCVAYGSFQASVHPLGIVGDCGFFEEGMGGGRRVVVVRGQSDAGVVRRQMDTIVTLMGYIMCDGREQDIVLVPRCTGVLNVRDIGSLLVR
ncbi:hypothetical protein Efla_007902 [Eimeria flavescens]